MKNQTTFVTALFDLKEERKGCKSGNKYLEYFESLLKTGINISVFSCPNFQTEIEKLGKQYSNMTLLSVMNLKDLPHYDLVHKCVLPQISDTNKDTHKFITLMMAKIYFVKLAMDENIYSTNYFAWIDIGIFHMFTDVKNSSQYLGQLGRKEFDGEFLAMPGCWNKGLNIELIYDKPNWRFCGSFFLGSKNKLVEFYDLSNVGLIKFTENYKIAWETNFWTWLEVNYNWSPDWYLADHNDTILYIPDEESTENIISKMELCRVTGNNKDGLVYFHKLLTKIEELSLDQYVKLLFNGHIVSYYTDRQLSDILALTIVMMTHQYSQLKSLWPHNIGNNVQFNGLSMEKRPMSWEEFKNKYNLYIKKINSNEYWQYKICVVTYTDVKYLEKAKRTIKDIREQGKYYHDLVVMIDNSFEFDQKYIHEMNIIVKSYPDIYVTQLLDKIRQHPFQNWDGREYNKTKQWNKLFIFDEYFKQWDYILFVDAGLRFFDRLDYFFPQLEPGKLIAMDDGYPEYTKKFNTQIELSNIPVVDKLKQIFDINSSYFLNCLFMFDTSLISNDTLSQLINLMNEYPICKTNEMAIMNIYFTNYWKPLMLPLSDGRQLFDWSERYGNSWTNYIALKYPTTRNFDH